MKFFITVTLLTFLILTGCESFQPKLAVEKPEKKKSEISLLKEELKVLKSRKPTKVVATKKILANGNILLKNANGQILVRVRIIVIEQKDNSECSPRPRVTVQVVKTKERRFICGKIGKVGDSFTIEWRLLKNWE